MQFLGKENSDQRPNLPPFLTWEDIEQGFPGQLNLLGVMPVPTIAERVFLDIARDWYDDSMSGPELKTHLEEDDELAFASLLLSVEWGKHFTKVAYDQIEQNVELSIDQRERTKLLWRICDAMRLMQPEKSRVMTDLALAISYSISKSIMNYMMMAWIARPIIDKSKIMPVLFDWIVKGYRNHEFALGLARGLCQSDQEFESFIDEYCRVGGETIIRDRASALSRDGFRAYQNHFWEAEAHYRRLIESRILRARSLVADCCAEPVSTGVCAGA